MKLEEVEVARLLVALLPLVMEVILGRGEGQALVWLRLIAENIFLKFHRIDLIDRVEKGLSFDCYYPWNNYRILTNRCQIR